MHSDDDGDYYSDGDFGDRFNEDDLNDDDYELLHDMLPPFKERVQKENYKNISDDLLKEYIWEANFDPDEAYAIVQENHKRMYNLTSHSSLFDILNIPLLFPFLTHLPSSFHFYRNALANLTLPPPPSLQTIQHGFLFVILLDTITIYMQINDWVSQIE